MTGFVNKGETMEQIDTYKKIIAGLEKDKKILASKYKVFGESATRCIDKAINFLKMLEKKGIPATQISKSNFVTCRVPTFYIGNPNKSPSFSRFTPNGVEKAVAYADKIGIRGKDNE